MRVIYDVNVTAVKGNCKLVNLQQKVRMRSKEGGSAEEVRNRGTKEIPEMRVTRDVEKPFHELNCKFSSACESRGRKGEDADE